MIWGCNVKLPLSAEEQQRLAAEENPHFVIPLVDELSRCQNVLIAAYNRVRLECDESNFDRLRSDVMHMIDQLFHRHEVPEEPIA